MKFSLKHIENHKEGLPLLLATLLFFVFGTLSAQQENPKKIEKKVNKYMQLAEEALAENNFPVAEANYRKAVSLDTSNAMATYNMGTLYYTKDKAVEAAERLSNAGKVSATNDLKHKAFHNQGNAFMKQKNYKAAVEAYKNALRTGPSDDKTRYNLALAKKLLEEKEKNKKKNSPKDNKDKEDKKKGKEQKKEDQKGGGDQNKDKKKGDEKKKDKAEPKNKDQKNQNEQQQEKENKPKQGDKQQQKPAPGELSNQQINNLLEAMKNQEREIQEKINAKKAKGAEIKSEKNW